MQQKIKFVTGDGLMHLNRFNTFLNILKLSKVNQKKTTFYLKR